MKAASEYIKFGGLLGFTSVFLLVLLKDRDVVSAVFDASVGCIVMAYAFKMLHSYTISLHNQVIRAKQSTMMQEMESSEVSDMKSLSDGSL